MQRFDPENGAYKAVYDDFTKQLKDRASPRKQAEWMFGFGKGIIDSRLLTRSGDQQGPESAGSKKEWGGETMLALKNWRMVPANLSADVVNKP